MRVLAAFDLVWTAILIQEKSHGTLGNITERSTLSPFSKWSQIRIFFDVQIARADQVGLKV